MTSSALLPGSKRMLDRRPYKKKPKGAKGGWKRRISLSHDETVSLHVRRAFAESTIAAKRNGDSAAFEYPKTTELLDSMHAKIRAHPILTGGTFDDLLRAKDARLEVVLVEGLDGPELTQNVPGGCGAFGGEEVPYVNVLIVTAAAANAGESSLHLTVQRRRIARGKFGLPNKRWVEGPYLVVAVIDNASGLTLRARIWPVWIAADGSTFGIIRSNYERMAMAAVYARGGVAFAPMHREQLVMLQEALGSHWTGNLAAYGFLPDLILFPVAGGLIVIVEIFGLTTFKKYREGKTKKEAAIKLALEKKEFGFHAIQTKELRSGKPKEVIEGHVAEWYRNAEEQGPLFSRTR
jgi:hypothetical protein